MRIELEESRLSNLKSEHRRLAREYAELKARVDEYNARRFLPPGEEIERRALQRAKLHKKDALSALVAEIERIERARAEAS